MATSVWEQQSFYSHKDVIIIGAGLAGLWSSLELLKLNNKLRILILDKGIIPTGASTRNAGFACFGSPTELLHDAATMGEEKMWQLVEMRYKGIEKIKVNFSVDDIGYDNCGGYELLNNNTAINNLDEKLHWLNRGLQHITGMPRTFSLANEKLSSFGLSGFTAMIENRLEAGLHSGLLVQALTKKALAAGVEIITSVEATGWEEENILIKIFTNSGISFTTNKLLFCTNAFTSNLTKEVTITPARGQILLTSPVKGLPFSGTFHFDEGFYYFRNLGNRVLLGGARNKAFQEETTTVLETSDVVQRELERFLSQQLIPGKEYAIENRWSGIMGFTQNKAPLIEQIAPNVVALVTCNGMGVALSPIMAEKAAIQLLQ